MLYGNMPVFIKRYKTISLNQFMYTVTIPNWNSIGVIPPIDEQQPTSAERSPYLVSLTDFVRRFGNTQERISVLNGFLRYREALHSVGLVSGFQWLDGSFLEHVELLESRHPNDIDVVTFFELPIGKTQLDLHSQSPNLFPATRSAQQSLKSTYHVDAYLEYLGKAPDRLVRQSSYWYSMWSHRRNQSWKGYIQIDLSPIEDSTALAELTNFSVGSTHP